MSVVADTSQASPSSQQHLIRLGFTAEVSDTGCTTATVSRPVEVDVDDVWRFEPAVGKTFDDYDVRVTGVDLAAGQATWTVAPTQEECEFWDGDLDWSWSTGRRPWAMTYWDSVRGIEATRWTGVQYIAGFRVGGRTRTNTPTIRKARRFFGRPSTLRRGRGYSNSSCFARWRRIGLTITFATFSGYNPCRKGSVQSGRVTGGTAPWTAFVGPGPGVALGTTASYLGSLVSDGRQPGGRAWTLAEEYVPYGDGGFAPTVSALLDRRNTVVGFEFWVGAAGD